MAAGFSYAGSLEGKKESEAGGGLEGLLRQEVVTLWTPGRDSSVLRRMIEEARDLYAQEESRGTELMIRINRQGDWIGFASGRARALDSVVLAEGVAEQLLTAVDRFLSESYQERCSQLGLPWRLNCSFEGPPGGGKSSLVRALAGHFGLDLHWLDLTEERLTDAGLVQIFASLPRRSLVYIEDIDRLAVARGEEEIGTGETAPRVTLSGLLNAIDGVAASEGRVLVMTANEPERLAGALTRPGRMDLRLFIGPATPSQARRLYERFFPSQNGAGRRFAAAVEQASSPISMAELQVLLCDNEDRPDGAIAAAERMARRTR